MNKQEIAEIKKQYSIKECAISRIAGAYVDAEKNIKATFNKQFLSLPEEEIYKYLDIFKKGLSGIVGKNITTAEYDLAQEEKGSMHDFLMKVRNTKLENEELLHILYERIAEAYPDVSNFLIMLLYNVYDIPGRGNDQFKNVEASDEVYEYMTCYICPVALEKPGLVFDPVKADFVQKETRWEVGAPVYSFTFPSFEDRCTDIHHVTIYTKKTDGQFDDFSKEILGLEPVVAADLQKETFQKLIADAVSQKDDPMEIVKGIQGDILTALEEEETEEISYEKLQHVLTENSISTEDAGSIIAEMKETLNNHPIMATNVVDKKKLKINAPDIEIKITAEKGGEITKQIINGKNCLVVPIEDNSEVEVNGVKIG